MGEAVAMTASGIAGVSAALLYAVRGRSAQIFGASSYRGSSGRRSVALTFDDGPSEGSLRLLELLAREQVKATFFQCGANVVRHGAYARQIVEAGHEVGNHTFSHARLCPRLGWRPNLRSPASVIHEFRTAQEAILSETGARPTLLRAPYGLRWFGVAAAQHSLDLHGVMWTAIGNDWALGARAIVARLLQGVGAGSILCLHDGRDIRPNPDIRETVRATGEVIRRLKDRGFAFETASQLLNR